MFDWIAERKIQEAIRRGDLDDLPLKGQPLPREEDPGVPPELRMGFKILKNAGMVPEEVLLKKELTTLEDLLECCRGLEERQELRRQHTLKKLHFDLLMERNRQNGSFLRYAGSVAARLGFQA